MEKILSLIAIATLVAAVAFAGYQYKEVHLPAFQKLEAKVEHQGCIQQCMQACRVNTVTLDKCNCSHCDALKVR